MTTVKEFIQSVGTASLEAILDNKVLEHHGIKGQKWGIRNKRTSKEGAAVDTKRSKKVTSTPKPKAHELSDEELRKAVNRMQMEKQYNKLSSGDSPRHSKAVKAGAAFVGGIALNVARTHIQNEATARVARALATKAVKKAAKG